MSKHTILRLDVNHVKRIEAVSIEPSASGAVIIAGRNAAGKSSVLDSILYALAGTRALPGEPLRHGAEKGSVTLDLGDLVVERGFTAAGGTSLTVRTKSPAAKLSKPQSVLDELLGAVGVDPIAFIAAKPEEQARVIAAAAGKSEELAELRAALKAKMAERQSMAAPLKMLEGQVQTLTSSLGELPPSEDVTALRARSATLRSLAEAERKRDRIAERVDALRAELATAQEEYRNAGTEIMEVRARLDGNVPEDAEAELAEIDQRADAAAAVSGQRHAMTRQLEDASEKLGDARAAYDAATIEIEQTREKLASVANGVTVDGVADLAVDEDGVRIGGVRFESLSQAEKIRAAVAIAVAASPRLPVVLVREGSLLDDDNMRLLAETAAELDAQVWIERVGTHDAGAIVIEDGRLREVGR